jgi:hypothetical protein
MKRAREELAPDAWEALRVEHLVIEGTRLVA